MKKTTALTAPESVSYEIRFGAGNIVSGKVAN